jgi:AraC family transcriptional regulator
MESLSQQLPTVNVQTYYAGQHTRPIGQQTCRALLTMLSTPQPLQFESSGRCHNFNFQISKAIQTVWKCGTIARRDVVAPGHVSLNAAQESFRCTVAPVADAVSLHIEIYPDWITRVREAESRHLGAHSGELIPMMAVCHERFKALSTRIAITLARSERTSILKIDQLLLELVVELIRRRDPYSIPMEPRGKLCFASLTRVLDYMNDQLHETPSLDELAVIAGCSPFHFARLFKATVGVSPHQYFIKQRIQRSQFMLARSEISITKVATDLGFDSSSHFAATFRRIVGVTPSAFRSSFS